MKAWALWQQPRPLIAFVLTVEVAALAATAVLAARSHVSSHDLLAFAAIAVAGLGQAQIGRRVEALRRRLTDTPYINLTSVWTFAGVLVLPAALVAALTVVLYVQINAPGWSRGRTIAPWRAVMNAAFVVVTCYSSRAVIGTFAVDDPRDLIAHPVTGAVAVLCGLAAYFFIGALLVVPSIWARTRSLAAVAGSREDNLLEVATLCLGAVLAAGVADAPVLALTLIAPMAVLHRGLLNQDFDHKAIRDHKTGLLNAASWHWAATRNVSHPTGTARTSSSLLMIDLDLFKSVNDEHGHLTGDQVLAAVATCIQGEVRRQDIVGRFGGEEFVVLLPDATAREADGIAERIRISVERLQVEDVKSSKATTVTGLSVSVGVADHPRHGSTVEEVLHAADRALYLAKQGGRNQVVRAPAA